MFDTTFLQISNKFKWLNKFPEWLREKIPISNQIFLLRSALGMTQQQLAKRIGSVARSIVRLEKEEVDPRLSTLERVADQLHCELLIRFVPKQDLGRYLTAMAEAKAKSIVRQSVGTANLEVQKPSEQSVQNEIKKLTGVLLKKRSKIWES